MASAKKPVDFWIFMTVLILLSLGSIMVFSSSAAYAYNKYGDAYFFLKKQLMWVAVSIAAMVIVMNIDYRKLGKWSPVFLVASLVLLMLVLIPGIGTVRNNARRWIEFGGQSLQPSEIAKISVILFFAYSLSKRKGQLQSFFKGLVPYLIVIGIFAALLLKEPHLSGTMVIAGTAVVILFCGGAKIKHFVLMAIPAVAGVTALILTSEERMNRVVSFIDPFKDPKGDGWQVIQSLYAIGSGGLFGRGIGRSLQKFLYLPEPYNDFILAVLAEELGFLGVLVVMLLFLILIWRGIKVAMTAHDTFGSLTAIGITALIAIQFIINVAVVTSSMPVTGMPLPFFSYGGTSLLFLMCDVGILLNISRYADYDRI